MDHRNYLVLEAALVKRLREDWQERSGPLYAKIAEACRAHNWNAARDLVPELDLTEVGLANREYIKYILLSFAVHGAGFVAGDEPSFVGVGTFDNLLNQVTSTMLQYLEHNATAQVQEQALQLIAQDEAEHRVQKGEGFKKGNTQIDIPKDSEAAKALDALRSQIAAEDLMAHGKDDSNHITVRWGLEGVELDALREYITNLAAFDAELGAIEAFQPGPHSEGSVPLVVRIMSPDLHFLHHEISRHAQFADPTFPEYKPHATLAYVKPEAVDKYSGLQTQGKFRVTGITISHSSGVQEHVPFRGLVYKFNPNHDSETGQFTGAGGSVSNVITNLNEKYPVNPSNSNERLLMVNGKRAGSFEVIERDGRLRIRSIVADEPGQGVGSLILHRILHTADAEGVPVELTASSKGSQFLNTDQLKAWYGKYGFEPEEGYDPALGYMVRKAKTKKFNPNHDEQGRFTSGEGAADGVNAASAPAMGTQPKTQLELQDMAEKMGFPRDKVLVGMTGTNFQVGDRTYMKTGNFNPKTGFLTIYPYESMGMEAGVLAHEIMHYKFQQAIKDEAIQNQINDNLTELHTKDGVSEYSRAYWPMAWEGSSEKLLAVNETLAEMARIKQETGNLPGDKVWQDLYNSVDKRGKS